VSALRVAVALARVAVPGRAVEVGIGAKAEVRVVVAVGAGMGVRVGGSVVVRALVRVDTALVVGAAVLVGGCTVAVGSLLHATSNGTSSARSIPATVNRLRPSSRRQSSIGPFLRAASHEYVAGWPEPASPSLVGEGSGRLCLWKA